MLQSLYKGKCHFTFPDIVSGRFTHIGFVIIKDIIPYLETDTQVAPNRLNPR